MDDREKHYTRKMYEYVLQQNQPQQNYYANNSNNMAMNGNYYTEFKANGAGNMLGNTYGTNYNQSAQNNNVVNPNSNSTGKNNYYHNQTKVNKTYQQPLYTPMVPNGPETTFSNPNMIPAQMMRPAHLNPNTSNNIPTNLPTTMPGGGGFLGFQMNPVSKNRKK
jgi:hypothetical protein